MHLLPCSLKALDPSFILQFLAGKVFNMLLLFQKCSLVHFYPKKIIVSVCYLLFGFSVNVEFLLVYAVMKTKFN